MNEELLVAYTKKQLTIDSCLRNIRNIMNLARPDMPLRIEYWKISENPALGSSIHNFTEWEQRYFHIMTGEEYFFIWDEEEDRLLYVVNVTGDSVLTALSELMNLIGKKF